LTSTIELKLAQGLFGEDALVSREALKDELKAIRASLRHSNSTPLEDLLIEDIALAFVLLRKAQHLLADFKQGPIQDIQLRESRLDRAMNRYLSAIRTLAQVRRLQIPTLVQLNVAQQQVNVAQPTEKRGCPG